nr:uncharacterized protein LOC117273283 [Nicotiana tomentosiformis]
MRFTELSRHATLLVSTNRERVHRFIEGLTYILKFGMTRYLETKTAFHQVLEIARRLEHVCRQEREDKKPRGSGGFCGSYSGGKITRTRQPSFIAPSARGSYGGYSSRPGQTQYQQPRPLRGCFEFCDNRHIVRDCPRFWMGRPQQGTQDIIPAPDATPPVLPSRGEGYAGSGCPRGRCHAIFVISLVGLRQSHQMQSLHALLYFVTEMLQFYLI